MAYQNDKRNQAPEQDEKQRPEEELDREQQSFGLPNSMMMTMPITPPPGTPNSVMREMLDDNAPEDGAEADRSYAGLRFGSLHTVLRQTGNIGSGSGPFFSMSPSLNRSRDGFDTSVGAHELTHMIRQNAAPALVSRSVSFNTIQRTGSTDGTGTGGNPQAEGEPKEDSTEVKEEEKKEEEKVEEEKVEEEKVEEEKEEEQKEEEQKEEEKKEEEKKEKEQKEEEKKEEVNETDQSDGNEKLPDPKIVFDLVSRNRPRSRSKLALLSKRPINIDGMVKYYREWCKRHNIDLGEEVRANDPIKKGLEKAQDALKDIGKKSDDEMSGAGSTFQKPQEEIGAGSTSLESNKGEVSAVSNPNQGGSVQPMGSVPLISSEDQPPAPTGNYHAASGPLKNSQKYTANARLVQSISGTINNWGAKFGTLMHNYNTHVTDKEKASLKPWDRKKWDLTESHGNYRAYTNWVAPWVNLGLGLYGMGTSAAGIYHGGKETVRKFKNKAAGASQADWIQSGLDTIGSAGSYLSSALSTLQSSAKLLNLGYSAKPLSPSHNPLGKFLFTGKNLLGHTKAAIPGLSIATGGISAATGTMEAIRGRMTRSELFAAEEEMKKAGRGEQIDPDDSAPDAVMKPDPDAPAPLPGVKTDQQKLQDIMTQGHQVAKFHMWSGGLKALAGGLSAAGGISSLFGAAPVAAAFQGTAALVNIAKFAFDRAYSAHMRNSVVASELNIDWDREMKEVMRMVHSYNNNYNMRDKYIREIILKAHGSGEAATRTEAYKQIRLKRAAYLINTAEQSEDPKASAKYKKTAEMVISAMGVTKRGGRYANGAKALLAEKLG